jgi:hypothetical protein
LADLDYQLRALNGKNVSKADGLMYSTILCDELWHYIDGAPSHQFAELKRLITGALERWKYFRSLPRPTLPAGGMFFSV